jgi:hypothetical protein
MIRFAIFIFAFSSSAAFALPLTSKPFALAESHEIAGDSYDFEGIVQLSNCSGAIVRYQGSHCL